MHYKIAMEMSLNKSTIFIIDKFMEHLNIQILHGLLHNWTYIKDKTRVQGLNLI